tara:strand:- start:2318 stop:3022 length:705 start_codon:yes stop_codon:yes gene_type:complete
MREYITKILSPIFLLLLIANSSQASFVMTLDDPTTLGIDVIIGDDMLPGSLTDSGLRVNSYDQVGALGVLSFSGNVGAFSVNVTTGVSEPVIGDGQLNLNSIQVSGATGTIIVSLTNTNFNALSNQYIANFGGTTDGSIDLNFLADSSNQEFSGTNFFNRFINPLDTNMNAFSENYSGAISSAATYSLSIIAEITHNSVGEVSSFSALMSPVPVPAAAWMFLMGLLTLVSFRKV